MLSPRWLLAIGWLGAAPALQGQAPAPDSTRLPSVDPGPLVSPATGVARARVTAPDGRHVVGRVLSADDTLLVLQPDRRPFELWARRRTPYDRRQLLRLELSVWPERRSQATVLGALIGTVVGAAIGAVALQEDCPSGGQISCNGGTYGVLFGGMLGVGVGGLLGRHVFGRDQWREVSPVGPREAAGRSADGS